MLLQSLLTDWHSTELTKRSAQRKGNLMKVSVMAGKGSWDDKTHWRIDTKTTKPPLLQRLSRCSSTVVNWMSKPRKGKGWIRMEREAEVRKRTSLKKQENRIVEAVAKAFPPVLQVNWSGGTCEGRGRGKRYVRGSVKVDKRTTVTQELTRRPEIGDRCKGLLNP